VYLQKQVNNVQIALTNYIKVEFANWIMNYCCKKRNLFWMFVFVHVVF